MDELHVSEQDVEAMRQSVDSFLTASGSLLDEQPRELIPGSPACLESQSFIRAGSIDNIVTLAGLLVEAAADEIQSFTRLTVPPVQTKSPFTCVRSSLESSALAAWLLDPDIDANERVKRSMAYLYEGLVQQRRLINLDRLSETIESTDVAKIELLLDELANQATQMGFDPIHDKKGRRISVGTRFPKLTELIGQELDQEKAYRLLSAAAHSHMWALVQFSFNQVPGDRDDQTRPGHRALEKALSTRAWVYLCVEAISAFAMVHRRRFSYLGWDVTALDMLLRELFNDLGLTVPDP